jgi:sialate O-acetylesterase
VVLTCDEVKDPVRVRYAWADWPVATPLYNAAGLPAAPFEMEVKQQ